MADFLGKMSLVTSAATAKSVVKRAVNTKSVMHTVSLNQLECMGTAYAPAAVRRALAPNTGVYERTNQ